MLHTASVARRVDAGDPEPREIRRLAERADAVADLVPAPVVVSALAGTGIDRLTARLVDALPSLDCAELSVPLTDDAMSLVSWLHDMAAAVDVEYGPETVTLAVTAKRPVIERARSRLAEL